jgi:hypothetical protein
MATDITGQVFGRLTVVRRSDERNRDRDRLWLCCCQCGIETLVIARLLRNGATQSCGCLRRERAKNPVSVASKPIPHPTQNFLLAASDPTSLASAKTGLTVMTAAATLADAA